MSVQGFMDGKSALPGSVSEDAPGSGSVTTPDVVG
jgi:hypothetical protein